MEMSHRSKDYVAVAEKKAEADLRKLMNIQRTIKSCSFKVVLHFSSPIPLNLLGKNSKTDYIHTGIWSEKH